MEGHAGQVSQEGVWGTAQVLGQVGGCPQALVQEEALRAEWASAQGASVAGSTHHVPEEREASRTTARLRTGETQPAPRQGQGWRASPPSPAPRGQRGSDAGPRAGAWAQESGAHGQLRPLTLSSRFGYFPTHTQLGKGRSGDSDSPAVILLPGLQGRTGAGPGLDGPQRLEDPWIQVRGSLQCQEGGHTVKACGATHTTSLSEAPDGERSLAPWRQPPCRACRWPQGQVRRRSACPPGPDSGPLQTGRSDGGATVQPISLGHTAQPTRCPSHQQPAERALGGTAAALRPEPGHLRGAD